MSDTVNQIQASYNPAEDRILLNIKTNHERVYQAWITRRFMKLLIPVLHGQHPASGKALFDERTSLIQQAEKEKNQLIGDFETAYEGPEDPDYPLGEDPILLTKITFKDIYSEKAVLVLEPEESQGIVLPYRAELLGPLIKIFSQALKAAEWALALEAILDVPEAASLQ